MNVPVELVIIDAVNTVFLLLGGIFLLRFLMHFGTPKMKNYSRLMCGALIGYALIHEAGEVLHWIYNFDAGFFETLETSILSLTFLVASVAVWREMNALMNLNIGGRKHGRM